MAKNTSHSQKNPHAQTQNDKQSIWQSLFTLHLLKLKKKCPNIIRTEQPTECQFMPKM